MTIKTTSPLPVLATLFAVVLLSSCGRGTNVRIDDSSPSLPQPQDGLTGVALKGAISGGLLTVTDAGGATLELRPGVGTGAGGSYSLTFTEAAVSRGIEAPLTLQVAGGEGITAICDVDLQDEINPDNDCEIDDDEFVAFGEPFPLPEAFTLRGTLASLPTASAPVYTLNVSPATDLASALAEAVADGSAMTTEDIGFANDRVTLLLELLTGLSLPAEDLTQVGVFDLTAIAESDSEAETLALVLIAFASAVMSELDPGDTDADTLPEVLARLQTELTLDDEGRLVATGVTLSRLSESMATGLQTLNIQLAELEADRDEIKAAQTFAESRVAEFSLLGDEEIDIATGETAADAAPRTRQFARSLHLAATLPSGGYTDGTVTLHLEAGGAGQFEVILRGQATQTGRLTAAGIAHYADGTSEALTLPPR